ncbi:hypothetical protein ACIA8K_18555 [Catenuloplanes sp. NPDC051500]
MTVLPPRAARPPTSRNAPGGATFGDLDPIAASEVLREAHRLAG